MSGDVTSDDAHRSSALRSITRIEGQVRASGMSTTRSPAHTRAAMVGTGDVKRHGTPSRTERPMATSRACHVGERSSCSVSSCSSTTTSAARSGTDAHTADRAPTTTSTPDAAATQSSGYSAVVLPFRRHSAAMRRARASVGATTMHGPSETAASITSSDDDEGPTRTSPPPFATSEAKRSARSVVAPATCSPVSARVVVRRGATSRGTRLSGEAATKNGRRRDAQRTAAHSTSSTISADGPTDVTFAIGSSFDASTSLAASSNNDITHPGTSRRCSGTRTRAPTITCEASASGTA